MVCIVFHTKKICKLYTTDKRLKNQQNVALSALTSVMDITLHKNLKNNVYYCMCVFASVCVSFVSYGFYSVCSYICFVPGIYVYFL